MATHVDGVVPDWWEKLETDTHKTLQICDYAVYAFGRYLSHTKNQPYIFQATRQQCNVCVRSNKRTEYLTQYSGTGGKGK